MTTRAREYLFIQIDLLDCCFAVGVGTSFLEFILHPAVKRGVDFLALKQAE